jgi:hypothetical protein
MNISDSHSWACLSDCWLRLLLNIRLKFSQLRSKSKNANRWQQLKHRLTSTFFFSMFAPISLIRISTRLLQKSILNVRTGVEHAHISLVIRSSRSSTFRLASAWSCFTRTGPINLYTSFAGVNWANSYSPSVNPWAQEYVRRLTFFTSSFSESWASNFCLASTAFDRSVCSFWYSAEADCNRVCSFWRVWDMEAGLRPLLGRQSPWRPRGSSSSVRSTLAFYDSEPH